MTTAQCFSNVAFLEFILSTPLSGSLRNYEVYRSTLRRYFWILSPTTSEAQKLPIFDDF